MGYKNGQFVDFDIDEALAMKKEISPYMLEVARDMSKRRLAAVVPRS